MHLNMDTINGNVPLVRFVQLPMCGIFGFKVGNWMFLTSTPIYGLLQNFPVYVVDVKRSYVTKFAINRN